MRQEFFSTLESALRCALDSFSADPSIVEVIRYSLFPGGKRVRPLLFLSLVDAYGGDPTAFGYQAAALEVLHAASMIHDDLPALDNDFERRGVPTCHIRFGEALALLASDAMVPEAITNFGRRSLGDFDAFQSACLLGSAYRDLCLGQSLDLRNEQREQNLELVYELKTGALFGASFALAGVATAQTSDRIDALTRAGVRLGVLFQIVNDYCDGTELRGATSSSDQRNQRYTLFQGLDPQSARGVLVAKYRALEKEIARLLLLAGVSEGWLSRATDFALPRLTGMLTGKL